MGYVQYGVWVWCGLFLRYIQIQSSKGEGREFRNFLGRWYLVSPQLLAFFLFIISSSSRSGCLSLLSLYCFFSWRFHQDWLVQPAPVDVIHASHTHTTHTRAECPFSAF